MSDYFSSCRLCPRECGTDRHDKIGVCGGGDKLRVSSAVLHMGEEPPISGDKGSGTVFFSGCCLRCRFCQNYSISSSNLGREITLDEFVKIMLDLQSAGAHNINLVTGTHFIPLIVDGLRLAKSSGLVLPILWNTGGFESELGLGLLSGYIDIYLPDIKTVSPTVSRLLFGTEKYANLVIPAVKSMIKSPVYDESGVMLKGTIIRHLVLPGLIENTMEVLEVFAREFMDKAELSLMFQYSRPAELADGAGLPPRMLKGGLGVTEKEYDAVLDKLDELGIEDGFIQELGNNEFWLPDFGKRNPFPEKFSKPVWHFKR